MTYRPLSDDAKIINEGRKNKLKDVDAPLREQVVKKLRNKLISPEKNIGEKVTEVWRLGTADRTTYLQRQREFLLQFDEFISPIYESSMEWGSALQIPTALTVCKTYHARMQSALIGTNPPFTVKSHKGANADRATLIQELMSYTLAQWTNRYEGIDDFIDRWLWNWVTTGVGIAKLCWETDYTRFVDVQKTKKEQGVTILGKDPKTGKNIVQPNFVDAEEEVEVTKKTFDGPTLKTLNVEDLLIVGGNGDPQRAEYVIEQSYVTAGYLWEMADRKIFDSDAVDTIIKKGPDRISAGFGNQIKFERAQGGGESQLDKTFESEKYHILEAYVKIDVDGSGILADIIVWVAPTTREVLAATYLNRRMPQGRRPYYKIDFYKRMGSHYGAGIVELLYSLSREIDAVHNIRLDVGILCSQPFGFYRPTASMTEQRLPIEPGAMIPLDNPQSDVYFPNLGNRTSFGMQEEASLNEIIQRFMSTNDIMMGSMGSQGATRTATGTRAIMQETNANLDVYIRRMHLGWKGLLTHLFQLLQLKLPPGFQFRILGDDGNDYWAQIQSPEELAGMYDFVLEANSANSNKQIQNDVAQQIYQLTSNPMDMQLGIVTPAERFEAIKNLMLVMGVKNYSRFIKKPQGGPKYAPIDILDATLAGVNIPLDPTQDLQGLVDLVQHFMEDEHMNGQFQPEQMRLIAKKGQEAQQMMQAMQAQQAQTQNLMQQQSNAGQANSMMANSNPGAQGAPTPVQGLDMMPSDPARGIP
jgi:hypothetical protein